MRSWGKTPHFLVALNCVCFSMAHADEAPTSAPAAVVADTSTAAPVNADQRQTLLCLNLQAATLSQRLNQLFQPAKVEPTVTEPAKAEAAPESHS
jgi:hypothetical protein